MTGHGPGTQCWIAATTLGPRGIVLGMELGSETVYGMFLGPSSVLAL